MISVGQIIWSKWTRTLWITVSIAIISSLLIQREVNDFLISFLLIPIFFHLCKTIYFSIAHSSYLVYVNVVFWGSLFVKISAVFIMNEILIHYNNMPFLSFQDDYIYNESAIELYDRWKISGFGFYDDIQHGSGTYSGFPIFSAIMMNIFGVSHLVPRIGNAILSSITSILSYKIVREYSLEENARLIGVLFMLSPLLVMFSTLQFKDTLLLFFTMIAVLCIVRLLKREQIVKSILFLSLAMGGISLGRPAALVPILGSYLIVLLYRMLKERGAGFLPQLLCFGAALWGLYQVWKLLTMLGVADYGDYFESRYSTLNDSDIMNTEAGITKSSLSILAGAPMYTLFGLFLPPPLLISWNSIDCTLNYSAWSCLYHITLIPFCVVAMLNIIRKRSGDLVPLYLLITFIVFKIGQAESVMSIFSPRQSLSTMMMMYLCLPMYKNGDEKVEKWMLTLAIFVMLGYSLIRAFSHGLF